jgi:hypothetical protein
VLREFLTSLLRRAELSDDAQVADIEYKLAEVEGTIAMLTEITESTEARADARAPRRGREH